MTPTVDFDLARALAKECSRLDENELAKILTAFKQYHRQQADGSLNKTRRLVDSILNQKTFVRSQKTRDYYEQIQMLLANKLGTDTEALVTLFWVQRLIKYEKQR